MRTKTVTINEQKFTIGALNMEQVERLMDEQKAPTRDFISRSWTTITESLMNAGNVEKFIDPPLEASALASTQQEPNILKLKRSLDFSGFMELWKEVIEFSGLAAPKSGELQAAMVP